MATPPSLTKTWHTTSYGAISPSRPELSFAGKTIVITGGGTGIGARAVQSFAEAGATHIAITARREATLQDVKTKTEAAFPKTKVSVYPGDVVDASHLKNMAASVGKWDVLVSNAGYLSTFSPIVSADAEERRRGWEVNIKGTFLTLQALTPTATEGASVVGVSTAVITSPSEMSQTGSSYSASKTGLLKLMEIYGAENPGIAVKTIHPGVIETDLLGKSGLTATGMPTDDVSLAAEFVLWVSSKEADFPRGCFVFANWDVEEMKAMADKIAADKRFLAFTIGGYPWNG